MQGCYAIKPYGHFSADLLFLRSTSISANRDQSFINLSLRTIDLIQSIRVNLLLDFDI